MKNRLAVLICTVTIGFILSPYTDLAQSAPMDTTGAYYYRSDKVECTFNSTIVTSAIGESNSYWNLADKYSPDSKFENDRYWFEGYAKAGLKVAYKLTDVLKLYSGVAIVGSGTLNKDIFDEGNSGRISPENGYLGFEYKIRNSFLDVSFGQQDFVVGSGMLVSVGASNGFERGAVTLMPRSAWKNTGILRFNSKHIGINAFALELNELEDPNNNHNILAGSSMEIKANKILNKLGFVYLNMINSKMVYPQGLTIIENARKDVQVFNSYIEINPFTKALPGFSFRMEYAYQWKNSISLISNGGEVSVSNTFQSLPWTPKFKYTYRRFSGDDPGTSKLERFDPLFYNGAPNAWASGGNASFTFYNSNIQLHGIQLEFYPSHRDIFQIYYWKLFADQKNSPIQFGQTARVGLDGQSLIVGVDDKKLANDFYLGYTRIINPKFYVNGGVALSSPDAGLKNLASDIIDTWTGAFVTLIYKI